MTEEYKEKFFNELESNIDSYPVIKEVIEGINLDLLKEKLTEKVAETFFKKSTGGLYTTKITKWIEENRGNLTSSTTSSSSSGDSGIYPSEWTAGGEISAEQQKTEWKKQLKQIPGFRDLDNYDRGDFLRRIEDGESYEIVKAAVEKAIQERRGNSGDTSSNNPNLNISTRQNSSTNNSGSTNSCLYSNGVRKFTGLFANTYLAGITRDQLAKGYTKTRHGTPPTQAEFDELGSYPYFGFITTEENSVKESLAEKYVTQVGNIDWVSKVTDWEGRFVVGMGARQNLKDFWISLMDDIKLDLPNTKIPDDADETTQYMVFRELYKFLKEIDKGKISEVIEIYYFTHKIIKEYGKLAKSEYEAQADGEDYFESRKLEDLDEQARLYLFYRNGDYKAMAKPENLAILARLTGSSFNQTSEPTSTKPESTSNNDDTSSPNLSDIKNQADQTNKKEQQQESQQVKESVNKLSNENMPVDERLDELKKVEEKEGKNSYREEETNIQNSKKDLFSKNDKDYRKTMGEVFRKKLTDNKLTGGEISKLIEDFENNQDNDWEKVQKSEKVLNQKIGQSAAKQRVNEIGNRIKKVMKLNDKKEMVKVLKDMLNLFNDTQNSVYLAEYKNQVQAWAKDLENAISGNKNNQTDNKGFFQPKVLIPVGLGAVILVGLAVVVIRSRQKKKIAKFE